MSLNSEDALPPCAGYFTRQILAEAIRNHEQATEELKKIATRYAASSPELWRASEHASSTLSTLTIIKAMIAVQLDYHT